MLPTSDDVRAAARRIAGLAHRTPVLTSSHINSLTGASVFFKCENFQKIGAFKFRGATNAVLSLPEELARRGVITHSSGNHGQALALAAKMRGIPATVVMPSDTTRVKLEAVKGYGAEVVFCEPNTASRERTAAEIIERTGATLVHPFDDAAVIAGQGTACLELAEDVPSLTAVLAPVGGGGLISGTALAAAAALPGAVVYGGEPEGANDAAQSLAAGRIVTVEKPKTIADGLRTAALGQLTFAIIHAHVRGIFTVSEDEIVAAMRMIWERMKIIIEPSSSVPVAALLKNRHIFAGQKVGVILSGGNVEIPRMYE